MAAGNHEIHAEEGEEHHGVELAHLDAVFSAVEPLRRHEEDDDDTDVEHALDDGHHGRVLVHSAEGRGGLKGTVAAGQKVKGGVYEQQDDGECRAEIASAGRKGGAVGSAGGQLLFVFSAKEKVGKEQDDDDCKKTKLLRHA